MRASICIFFLFLAHTSSAQETRVTELGGRSLEMRVIKADDLSPAPWPAGPVELKIVPTKPEGAADIYMLLQSNGIAPDPGAFSLFYDLNPDLKSIADIVSDVTIQIPSVSPAQQLADMQSAHELVEITVDPDLRRELNIQIEKLQQFEPGIAQSTVAPAAQVQIKNLLNWYQEIEKRFKRRTDPPLRHATLVELLSEAKLLGSILEGAAQRGRPLSAADTEQIALIHEDLKLEMQNYGQLLADTAPKPQTYYLVTVVVKGISGKALDNLRVYYTYNGLFHPLPANPPVPSFAFTRLGSGTSENLLMKNYQIWAARDGDANHPLANPYPLQINSASPSSLTVELSVAQAQR
jgi:hypothetical protein